MSDSDLRQCARGPKHRNGPLCPGHRSVRYPASRVHPEPGRMEL